MSSTGKCLQLPISCFGGIIFVNELIKTQGWFVVQCNYLLVQFIMPSHDKYLSVRCVHVTGIVDHYINIHKYYAI